jgi:hypothetical protein
MHQITASDDLHSLLTPLTHLTEIRDSSGHILGYYAPVAESEKLLYVQAAAHFDPHEIQRRKESEQQDFTLAEVLEHVKSLEPN